MHTQPHESRPHTLVPLARLVRFGAPQIVVRLFFGFLAILLTATLIGQCILTHSEGRSLVNTFSYFTIQSNVLVLATSAILAIKPNIQGTAWRLFRLAALAGIATTGFVYILFLAKYVHLSGIALAYNAVFHYFMPIATVLGFLLLEPKHGFSRRDFWFIAWPVAWLVYTMVRGAVFHPLFTGFSTTPSNYPYEFLDISKVPLVEVILSILLITTIILTIGALFILYDKRVKQTILPEN